MSDTLIQVKRNFDKNVSQTYYTGMVFLDMDYTVFLDHTLGHPKHGTHTCFSSERYPKYRGELIAASRDFAKDSRVKVTNLYNDREVVVTIKDFGPKRCEDWTEREQRLMGPCQERVLDLSKTAFLKLATFLIA